MSDQGPVGRRLRMADHSRLLKAPVVALGIGVAITVIVLAVPDARVAFVNPNLHVALNAFEGVVAAVLAFLWTGRLRQQRALADALLVLAFAIAAVVSLVLAVVPSGATNRSAVLWTAAAWRVVVASTIVGAAVSRGRGRSLAWLGAPLAALAVGVVCGVLGRGTRLTPDAGGIAVSTDPSDLDGHPMLRVAHGLGIVLYGVAAIAFARRAERDRDPVLGLLAVGAVLAAVARVHYTVFPSLYTNVVFTGDALRFGAYLVFAVAGAVEIQRYWRAVTDAAVVGERRSAAREVHDGVLQELTFIRSQVLALTLRQPDSQELASVADSADRALAEARNLIPVLAGDGGTVPALGPVLLQAAEAVAGRRRVSVELVDEHHAAASQRVAHALSRVVRESTTNAAVHGGATTVRLRLAQQNGQLSLTITDDGSGFEAADDATGFGLVSMRERIAALGGDVSIQSARGAATVVEVRLPNR